MDPGGVFRLYFHGKGVTGYGKGTMERVTITTNSRSFPAGVALLEVGGGGITVNPLDRCLFAAAARAQGMGVNFIVTPFP